MGVDLYVGGDAGTVQREPMTLTGKRCFTGAIRPKTRLDLTQVTALLDSGAFSDKPAKRLTPATALERQLEWENKARRLCKIDDWKVHAIVSYDRLIDETWVGDVRQKRRWSLNDAESAVEETVTAAQYLASKRSELMPRKLVLTAQGVDSLLFPILAFGFPPLWGIVAGQFAAKVVGGAIWSWILTRRIAPMFAA